MSRTKPLYQILASLAQAYQNCAQSGNEWARMHDDRAEALVKHYLPSGSGWDLGTRMPIDDCNGEKLLFIGSFHHMNDAGMYDRWTDHVITVRGSLLSGMDLKISGRNRNDIKDYLHEMFEVALKQPITDDDLRDLYMARGLDVKSVQEQNRS